MLQRYTRNPTHLLGHGWLFVVVRFMAQDGEGAIQLLYEEEPYHLMVEGHLRERHLVVSHLMDAGSKTESPAYNEGQRADAAVHLFLQVLGKTCGGMFRAMLIEEYNPV